MVVSLRTPGGGGWCVDYIRLAAGGQAGRQADRSQAQARGLLNGEQDCLDSLTAMLHQRTCMKPVCPDRQDEVLRGPARGSLRASRCITAPAGRGVGHSGYETATPITPWGAPMAVSRRPAHRHLIGTTRRGCVIQKPAEEREHDVTVAVTQ